MNNRMHAVIERAVADLYASYRGKKVKQVSNAPGFEQFFGRESVIVDVIQDENGRHHVKTEDDVWCPAKYLEIIE